MSLGNRSLNLKIKLAPIGLQIWILMKGLAFLNLVRKDTQQRSSALRPLSGCSARPFRY